MELTRMEPTVKHTAHVPGTASLPVSAAGQQHSSDGETDRRTADEVARGPAGVLRFADWRVTHE